MTKSEANLAFALLTYYAKKFEDKYGKKPNINKYKEKHIKIKTKNIINISIPT